jgi:uncharacterized membrane protein YdjX (TVP38/TMEM64 family)
LFRALLLIAVVLLIPILPFLLFGEAFEEQVVAWTRRAWSPAELVLVTVGLLSSDILLPVPASGVCTYAAGVLGFGMGLLAGWSGMSIGAVLGYEAARWAGHPLARRMIANDDLERLQRTATERGVWSLVLLRAVPVLAEASVILAGTMRMQRRRFLAAVLTTNLVLAAVYAAFGAFAVGQGLLIPAVVASLVIPLAGLFVLRGRL